MEEPTSEKGTQYGGVQYEDAQPRHADAKRGSIYQIIPPGERRMSAQGRRISIVDDIFGEIKEDGPNYRNVRALYSSIVEVLTCSGRVARYGRADDQDPNRFGRPLHSRRPPHARYGSGTCRGDRDRCNHHVV